MPIALRHLERPIAEPPQAPPVVPPGEYEARMDAVYSRADADWVLVYGDREHAANLAWTCGFDPRFEEAALLLGPRGRRLLLVGNEGTDYAALAAHGVEVVLAQSFSLLGQARTDAPRLVDVLRVAGVSSAERAAVVGWKYLGPDETDDPREPAFVPAFVVDALRSITGEAVVDRTDVLMAPDRGLRVRNSAAQIAAFEWGASRASAAVMRVVAETEPGMIELEAAEAMRYAGELLSCHPMLSADSGPLVGLRSPGGRRIGYGDAITTAIGYAGGLCARAGILTRDRDDDWLADYVTPYVEGLAAWYAAVGVDAVGGEVHDAVMDALAGSPVRPALNPGHLGSLDEWLHSPMRPGSGDRLAAGMVLQCDVIPVPMPPGRALNCEDTIALADAELRAELQRDHPKLWQRIEARRAFVRDELGIRLGEDVLPLSSSVGYYAPFWLDDTLVCTLD